MNQQIIQLNKLRNILINRLTRMKSLADNAKNWNEYIKYNLKVKALYKRYKETEAQINRQENLLK